MQQLVLDNNILFSIINTESISAYLFDSIRANFIAPEFIKSELDEHKEECLAKSKLSEQEFEIRQKDVEESIKFFKSVEYGDFLEKAEELIQDPDDIDFLALALSTNSAIWSNDSHLKQQSLVKVFTTQELVEKLLKDEV